MVEQLGVLAILLVQGQAPPRPAAVLDIQGPYNLPTLYNAPDVVVYDNGLVIYQTANDLAHGKQFKFVVVTPAQMHELLPPSQLRALFAGDTVPRQDTARVHPHAPLFVLDIWQDTRHERVVIHGDPSMGSTAFSDIVRRLSQFKSSQARAWVPDSIEIELRRIDHACNPTEPVPWPATLPHPVQLADTTVVRFLIASTHLNRAKDLLKKHGNWDCTPVVLNGRSWAFAYDFPYPAQESWLRQ
jgi:hypothetical protein